MIFRKNLYLGKSITNKYTLLWKLKHGHYSMGHYVISISSGEDQLECIPCYYLKQRSIRETLGEVVGIARDYNEMLEVIIRMTEESLKKTGSADIKNYLTNKKRMNDK